MDPTSGDPAHIARALLTAAGLPVSDDEAAGLAAAYPALRQQADSLYQPFLSDVPPDMGFTAAFEPSADA